jgi:hypothetical protein
MDINIVVGLLHTSKSFNPTTAISEDGKGDKRGDQVNDPSIPLHLSSRSLYSKDMLEESVHERSSK